MLKKVLSVMLLATIFIFVRAEKNAAAQEFDFVPLTTGEIYSAQVVYGIDFLALRTGPSVNYPEIARIPPGSYIEVSVEHRRFFTGFVRVNYRGVYGYAHSNYIRLGSFVGYVP